jgi:histidine triad (HIT) family protein
MHKDDCIFCKIIDKSIPSKVNYEDDLMMAFDDIDPQAPVHVVVVSKDHVEKLSDLKEENEYLIGRMVMAAKKIAKGRGIEGSGYRVVINCNKDGGQAVYHLHLHLLGGRAMKWPPG